MIKTMENTIKSVVKSLFSFSGVLNTHHKGELFKHNDIKEGYEILTSSGDFNTDKANLNKDYHNVKNDVARSWETKEELVY